MYQERNESEACIVVLMVINVKVEDKWYVEFR